MSTFQIIVLGIFGALILIGVGVFASMSGLTGSRDVGPVVMWGTIDEQTMGAILNAAEKSDPSGILKNVDYEYKDPATYNAVLINSMASGASPDLFLIRVSDLQAFSDKIIPIPYRSVSQSTFLTSFIDGVEQFLTPQGALAMPFSVDPLVMYWNRDMFASAGVANPPAFWNDFLDLAPKITSLDNTSPSKQATVALGEWRNVNHAKEILLTLFMQAGDEVIVRNTNGSPTVVLGASGADSVVRFYTEFANPSKTSYSWNRSLPLAQNMFTSGDLAVYFGLMSEANTFTSRNPNLRYGVAPTPQIEGNVTRFTYGKLTGAAISRSARNPNGALAVAQVIGSKGFATAMVLGTALPPVRRDISLDTSANAAAAVGMQMALISRDFLDPNPKESSSIFQGMVESVISGAETPSDAVRDAASGLKSLLSQPF